MLKNHVEKALNHTGELIDNGLKKNRNNRTG